jgi:hypothetical protein
MRITATDHATVVTDDLCDSPHEPRLVIAAILPTRRP